MAESRTRGKGEVISRNPKEHEDKMIQDILENFDFQKCRSVMQVLNWEWATVPGIPTIDRLKKAAENRLRDAMDMAKKGKCSKSTYFVSSGGLRANAWSNRYGQVEGVRLEFVLTDWDTDGDY